MTAATGFDPTTFKPVTIDGARAAFPASVSDLMPPMEAIPDEFKNWHGTEWNRLFADWFYSGLKSLDLTPQPGIDKDAALRHIKTVMGSWEPKHEHKEAAVAYLLSLWFTDPKWTKAEQVAA